MALLQRQPITVEAGDSADERFNTIRRTSAQVLRAGQTRLPFVGALIRNAIPEDELQQYQDGKLPYQASFLKPVNQAMRRYWQDHEQSNEFGMTNLAFVRSTSESLTNHTDQVIKEDLPSCGPLSATLTIVGSVQYYLNVSKEDPFSRQYAERIGKEGTTTDQTRRGYRVEADPSSS